LKGGFLEIPKANSFWLYVLVLMVGEKLVRLTDLGWHAQHTRAAIYHHIIMLCSWGLSWLLSCGHQYQIEEVMPMSV
jgi:hypothetical protein